MSTTISTEKSRQTISRLIREKFEKIDFSSEYIYHEGQNLIDTARAYGLNELADELQDDMDVEMNYLKAFKNS